MLRAIVTETLPKSRTRSVWMLALFAAVQLADGTMTLVGVERFGPRAEGNPLLASAMATCGVVVTLISAKAVAIALAIGLHAHSRSWVVLLLTLLYVYGALCPWAVMLAAP